jgi:formate-dependent nitrite reductase membrane component NrfD
MSSVEYVPPQPDAAFAGAATGDGKAPAPTYYNLPLLNKPHWGWNVVTYLFLGGAMGGSGVLTALSQRSGDAPLERTSRYLSLVLAAACPAVLVSHLGRPERFHHMMRIVKVKSAMSMGVWGLVGFSGAAGITAFAQLARDGVVPRWIERIEPKGLSTGLQALLGAFIMGYTGVLLTSTAIPLWGKGKYHIPAFFVCSAIASSCALNSLVLCADGNGGEAQHKLERLEAFASIAELGLLLHFRTHAGETGKPMFEGKRGERLRNLTMLAGIAAPLLLNAPSVLFGRGDRRPSLLRTVVASGLTLLGGYILRETLIESGKESADDPRQAFVQPK